MIDNELIEAAYLSGFEPSSDSLTPDELFEEAQGFLYEYSITK